MTAGMYVEQGGEGGPPVVFLHGSGASGAVWRPVTERLRDRRTRCRWLVVDLPGHGRSPWLDSYSPDAYAAAVAAAITAVPAGSGPADTPVTVVGHSLGGMIALALADGTRGVAVASALVIAMKVGWTEEELARRAALAAKPVRIFTDERQALTLFGRVSGMSGAAFTDGDRATGVTRSADGHHLSGDPAITAAPPATGRELAALMRRAACPVELACGDRDPGIDPHDMARVLGHAVTVLPGTGHNAHIEEPDRVADLVEHALSRAAAGR